MLTSLTDLQLLLSGLKVEPHAKFHDTRGPGDPVFSCTVSAMITLTLLSPFPHLSSPHLRQTQAM